MKLLRVYNLMREYPSFLSLLHYQLKANKYRSYSA